MCVYFTRLHLRSFKKKMSTFTHLFFQFLLIKIDTVESVQQILLAYEN